MRFQGSVGFVAGCFATRLRTQAVYGPLTSRIKSKQGRSGFHGTSIFGSIGLVSPVVVCRHIVRAMRTDSGKSVAKSNLPSKTCLNCGLPFVWRKKWERCWDDVKCCSKRCKSEYNSARRREGDKSGSSDENRSQKSDSKASSGSARATSVTSSECNDGDVQQFEGIVASRTDETEVNAEQLNDPGISSIVLNQAVGHLTIARPASKAQKSSKKLDPSYGQKPCDRCGRLSDVLVRCTVDETRKWKLICPGHCWPKASGGIIDGDESRFPHYKYGGMWKNFHKDGVSAKMPRSAKRRQKLAKQTAECVDDAGFAM